MGASEAANNGGDPTAYPGSGYADMAKGILRSFVDTGKSYGDLAQIVAAKWNGDDAGFAEGLAGLKEHAGGGIYTAGLFFGGRAAMGGEAAEATVTITGKTLIIPAEKAEFIGAYQAAADNGTLVRTDPSTVRSSGFRKALAKEIGPAPGTGFDADHTVELCVGGANCTKTNGQWLQSGRNRSAGSQIGNQVKNDPIGTVYTNVQVGGH